MWSRSAAFFNTLRASKCARYAASSSEAPLGGPLLRGFLAKVGRLQGKAASWKGALRPYSLGAYQRKAVQSSRYDSIPRGRRRFLVPGATSGWRSRTGRRPGRSVPEVRVPPDPVRSGQDPRRRSASLRPPSNVHRWAHAQERLTFTTGWWGCAGLGTNLRDRQSTCRSVFSRTVWPISTSSPSIRHSS